MKLKVKYSAIQEKAVKEIKDLQGIDRWKFSEKLPDIPLAKILSVCAGVWGIEASLFNEKINYRDRKDVIVKNSFLWACKYFSNDDSYRVTQFIKKTGGLCRVGIREIDILLINQKPFADVIVTMLIELKKTCPTRLINLFKPDLSMVQGVDDQYDWSFAKLTRYQISCITIKSLTWFYNDNNAYSMLAFPPGHTAPKYVQFKRTSDHILFHKMQDEGYRFVGLNSKEHKEVEIRNEFCDRCIHRLGCDEKTWRAHSFSSMKFTCFEPAPNPKFKVDMDLLLPVPFPRLQ